MDNIKKEFTAIVVDDDVDTVDLFVEFLGICDVRVLAKALDGKTAVDKYKEFSPDVVFSDVMMPEYDGFYVLENIKKINPKTIIVMVTGDVRQDTTSRLEQLGADAIIHKPFAMQDIMSKVSDLISRNAQLFQIS